MVIEWLKVRVSPEVREKYFRKDEKIWTAFLVTCPGFLGKEVWINPQNPTELIIVIRWATRQQWKSIPQEHLEQIEQEFIHQMGDIYPIIEAAEYQLRKFPQA